MNSSVKSQTAKVILMDEPAKIESGDAMDL